MLLALLADDDKENKRRHHTHHGHDSASSNNSITSSSNELSANYDDDEQDEALACYAVQVEHLHEYEAALSDSSQDILGNKEPVVLTKQLRRIVKQAQDTVDYDQDEFVTDLRANLHQQEEQVAAAQRNNKQNANGGKILLLFPSRFIAYVSLFLSLF